MYSKIRSLIFKFDPEMAHNLAIKALKFNFIPKINNRIYKSMETKIFGKTILNPIGVAAGFDKDAEVYNSLFKLGFGFVEVGTVTPKKQFGNSKPRVFRLEEDQALINRLGFNNSGAEIICNRISKNKPKGLLGVNIGPNKDTDDRIKDYLVCFKKFYKIADYLTINISSPNTENLRSFHNKDELDQLLTEINSEKKKLNTEIPIALKISPDIQENDINQISEVVLRHNLKVIIISNSTDKNREYLKNINKLEKGGLSGKPLEIKSNLLINKFYKNLKNKIKIIGVGGIDSGTGVFEKFINGASLVQLYTSMVFKGPDIASTINNELVDILNHKGAKNISEIIGTKN